RGGGGHRRDHHVRGAGEQPHRHWRGTGPRPAPGRPPPPPRPPGLGGAQTPGGRRGGGGSGGGDGRHKTPWDGPGALPAHGLAGVVGTLCCGIFTSPRLAELNGVGDPGVWYSGSFHQLGVQALGIAVAFATVFVISYAVFAVIKHTIGLRVTPEEE